MLSLPLLNIQENKKVANEPSMKSSLNHSNKQLQELPSPVAKMQIKPVYKKRVTDQKNA